ncbi:MAG: hypothetical protein KGL59_12125, partial [Acidobacteriota bacterium]|nr:hypothetical protein [Acidobacteriota bacterium]
TTGEPVPPNKELYVRVRFRLSNVSRIWRWKRFFFGAYGALMDVKLCDVREAWNVKDGPELKSWILPIGTLNFFVVAPSSFHVLATSPCLQYTRILEGRPWERYLRERTSLWGDKKLSIYQWMRDGISADTPMRIYLDLGTDPRDISRIVWVLGALFIFILASYAASLSTRIPADIGSLLTDAENWAGTHFWGTFISVVIFVGGAVLWHLETIAKWRRRLRQWSYEFERWLYQPRS